MGGRTVRWWKQNVSNGVQVGTGVNFIVVVVVVVFVVVWIGLG
jgi:hypothetical protein